jgi:malate synthase
MHFNAALNDGRAVTRELFDALVDDEMAVLREALGPQAYDAGNFQAAIGLFKRMSTSAEFEDFLTLPAYRLIA